MSRSFPFLSPRDHATRTACPLLVTPGAHIFSHHLPLNFCEYSHFCCAGGLANYLFIMLCSWLGVFSTKNFLFSSAALFLSSGDGCPSVILYSGVPLCCHWANLPDLLASKCWRNKLALLPAIANPRLIFGTTRKPWDRVH